MNDRNTEVLEQYDLEAVSLRRGRGAWVCETDQGIKLLREYKGTMKRLEFEEEVLGLLKESGGLRVDQYVRNREGGLLSAAGDGSRYILKDWYMDREYNVRDEEEMAQAVVQIAGLHKQLRRVEVKEEWNLGSILAEPMETEMERHNRELKRVLPEDFQINFVRMESGVCYVNISAASLAALPEDETLQRMMLWSLADSLYSIDAVEELRLLADGEELTHFGLIPVESAAARPKG